MNCLCEKDSALFSSHSTSPFVPGCPAWGASESEVKQSSMSTSLSFKVDVMLMPPQHHKSKTPSFQFQEQDSSSTQSTDQSYPEVGSAQSGQISVYHSSIGSTLGSTGEKSMGCAIRSFMGSQDFTFPPPQLNHSQSLAHLAFHYADSCYTGQMAAAYGPKSKPVEPAPVRIPLPLDVTEEPIYVNSKQYHAILRRRQYRAKLEAHSKPLKDRKPYLHESRHLHAIKRARGAGGRFLNTKKLQQSKLTSANHCLTRMNLSAESKMHQMEQNYMNGADHVTYAARDMKNYTADKDGGTTQHHLSVYM
ncbi:nuclear transcription factor Y subunit A-3 [Cajanus cajan]|uniref:nuclear transcription factor Y subunit A-3 n=1 Tax=Cajanus cajan TaxID=3821 RepID=UPI00098DB94B|nr:nuclear transcription factor Y subunit A-3 [Cajanus cajan]